MKRKKILIIQNVLLHYRKPVYNELAKYYDITVLHSSKPTITDHDFYKERIKELKKIGPFYYQNDVQKELKHTKYDLIIVTFNIRLISNILLLLFNRYNIKVILWGMGTNESKIGNYLRKIMTFFADAVILYTKNARNYFIKQGINEDKLFVANNTFHVDNRIKSFNYKKDSILFVGSLDLRKENDALLKAFSLIIKEIPSNINLNIIGEGTELYNLRNLAISLGIEKRVNFIGRIIDTNILEEYYKNAICSVSFGQAGLSVLQAFAYGVPFITKKNAITGGEIINIQDGNNGYLINNSINSLSTVLKLLILDEKLAKEFL